MHELCRLPPEMSALCTMPTPQHRWDYLVAEIARLGGIVEAARLSGRNVLQRALLVHHSVALAELELEGVAPPPAA